MIKAVEYLFDFFSFILKLFTELGQLIVAFVQVLGKAAVFLYDVVDPLPTVLKASVLALIAVSVLYKVLGRESQS